MKNIDLKEKYDERLNKKILFGNENTRSLKRWTKIFRDNNFVVDDKYTEYKKRTRKLSKKTIIGAATLGIGWGISGLCPGSTLATLGSGNIIGILGIAGIFVGTYLAGRYLT